MCGSAHWVPPITRAFCEEKWIPKDLAPPKKLVPAPKASASQPPKKAGEVAHMGAKPAAKPTHRLFLSQFLVIGSPGLCTVTFPDL